MKASRFAFSLAFGAVGMNVAAAQTIEGQRQGIDSYMLYHAKIPDVLGSPPNASIAGTKELRDLDLKFLVPESKKLSDIEVVSVNGRVPLCFTNTSGKKQCIGGNDDDNGPLPTLMLPNNVMLEFDQKGGDAGPGQKIELEVTVREIESETINNPKKFKLELE